LLICWSLPGCEPAKHQNVGLPEIMPWWSEPEFE